MISSMVVNDFHIVGIPFCPNKTDTPLLVNPNAPLSLAIFLESLQMIGRKLPQIVEGSGDVEHNQLSTGANLKIRREFLGERDARPFPFPCSERIKSSVVPCVKLSIYRETRAPVSQEAC
jgi:hypothetical protein